MLKRKIGVEVASVAPGESTTIELAISSPQAGYKVGAYRLYETHHGDHRPFGPMVYSPSTI
jgi:hypothetical protein